jgi:putative restriction endonuclease
LSIPKLLIASHIVPWSVDIKNRLNPENGLCLNSIHDKAFDEGLITITSEYKIKISGAFSDFEKEESVRKFFKDYENSSIIMPERYFPNKDFLKYHQENIFIK